MYQITVPGVLIFFSSNTREYSVIQIIPVLFVFLSVAFLLSFQSDVLSRFPLRVLFFLTTQDAKEKPNNLFQCIINSVLAITVYKQCTGNNKGKKYIPLMFSSPVKRERGTPGCSSLPYDPFQLQCSCLHRLHSIRQENCRL